MPVLGDLAGDYLGMGAGPFEEVAKVGGRGQAIEATFPRRMHDLSGCRQRAGRIL